MVVLCRFILLKNLAALSNLPATCFSVTSLFKAKLKWWGLHIAEWWATVCKQTFFELMRGLERRSFLNWGRETCSFNGSFPSDLTSRENTWAKPTVHINKAGTVQSCVHLLIKQTKHGQNCSVDGPLLLQRERNRRGLLFNFKGCILDQIQIRKSHWHISGKLVAQMKLNFTPFHQSN